MYGTKWAGVQLIIKVGPAGWLEKRQAIVVGHSAKAPSAEESTDYSTVADSEATMLEAKVIIAVFVEDSDAVQYFCVKRRDCHGQGSWLWVLRLAIPENTGENTIPYR
ncbi:MAG: hypothetical protein R2864_05540 [Syntrophotaleaceae bacterium]